MGRKHSKEEVLFALRAKNCIITEDQSITKKVEKLIPVTDEERNRLFKKWAQKDPENLRIGTMSIVLGQIPQKFIEDNKKELAPKRLMVNEIVQEPFCINVTPGELLGNKSWGKIDYLVKVHGFRVVRL